MRPGLGPLNLANAANNASSVTQLENDSPNQSQTSDEEIIEKSTGSTEPLTGTTPIKPINSLKAEKALKAAAKKQNQQLR